VSYFTVCYFTVSYFTVCYFTVCYFTVCYFTVCLLLLTSSEGPVIYVFLKFLYSKTDIVSIPKCSNYIPEYGRYGCCVPSNRYFG